MPAQTVIKLRRDTDANWTSANPTLAAGEAGFESDTGKLKIGDGSTAWTSLGYVSGGASVEVSDAPPSAPEPNTLWWESDTGTLFIYYDGFWVEAVTGLVGPAGADGADNIVVAATAPTNTDVLWVDTSEPGDAVLPLGGTTGQILQKASASDYDTEWATNPIYPIGANGSLLTSDGTDPSWLANSGTQGDILQVNATGGLEFATPSGGGETLLDSGSLTASTIITGIDQSYRHLKLVVKNYARASSFGFQMRYNGTALFSNYHTREYNGSGWSDSQNSNQQTLFIPQQPSSPNSGIFVFDILNYTDTTNGRQFIIYANPQTTNVRFIYGQGVVRTLDPINEFYIFVDSCDYEIWGRN